MVWDLGLARLMALKMFQLCLAELLLCRYIPLRRYGRLKVIFGGILCILIAFFVPIEGSSYLLDGCIVFTLHVLLSMVWLYGSFQIDLSAVIFLASAGKVITCIASLMELPLTLLDPSLFAVANLATNEGLLFLVRILIGMLIVYPISYFCFGRHLKRLIIRPRWKKILWILFFVILIMDVFIYLLYSQTIEKTADMTTNLVYNGVKILLNILILLLLNIIYENSQVETELDSVKALWSRAKTHYALSKENIDAINRKCHDLKHRMMELKNSNQKLDLSDIEEAIDIYDRRIKTGNEVLDVVLAEKMLLCTDKKIRMECMADGSQLAFMDTTDLFVLFGNLIDNCIEAVEPLEQEKRYILLNVLQEEGFTLIHTTNPYQADLQWDGSLPRTTKKDTEDHGYGMLSIQTVIRSYGGELNIRTEDDIFDLSIIIPLKQSKTKAH